MPQRRYGSTTVETSREDKVLFPDASVTKGDLIDYYESVAEAILPHLDGRPLTMQRYPDGIGEEGFYEKKVPDYFPDWIERVEVERKENGTQLQIICDKLATLVYLANQACITPHIWLSRRQSLKCPDRLIIDVDPPGDDFHAVRRVARMVRDLFQELGLTTFLMLTGSRGVHVAVALRADANFDEVREFARRAAALLVRRHPERLTTEARKENRGDRVFLDTARNAYAQTAVAPYSVRARPGASVATPIEWDELGDRELTSSSYDIHRMIRRLAQKEDPWKNINRHAATLDRASDRLARIAETA